MQKTPRSQTSQCIKQPPQITISKKTGQIARLDGMKDRCKPTDELVSFLEQRLDRVVEEIDKRHLDRAIEMAQRVGKVGQVLTVGDIVDARNVDNHLAIFEGIFLLQKDFGEVED